MANRSPPPSSFRTKRPFALTGAHEHLPGFAEQNLASMRRLGEEVITAFLT